MCRTETGRKTGTEEVAIATSKFGIFLEVYRAFQDIQFILGQTFFYTIKPIETAENDKFKFQPPGQPFNWFYSLFFTADPDLKQDPASLLCCLYKWTLHYSLPDFLYPRV